MGKDHKKLSDEELARANAETVILPAGKTKIPQSVLDNLEAIRRGYVARISMNETVRKALQLHASELDPHLLTAHLTQLNHAITHERSLLGDLIAKIERLKKQ